MLDRQGQRASTATSASAPKAETGELPEPAPAGGLAARIDKNWRGKVDMVEIAERDGATASRPIKQVSRPLTAAAPTAYDIIGVLLAAVAAVAFSLRSIFVKLAY